ncbi:MAG: MBL fold metallo-hydrolase [Muribaculum sp.]|nr:MBL fold metallo-hydrolase [Muribaculum sp.]
MEKLTYIWHDCFVFENDEVAIVFDYWKDPLSKPGEMPLFLKNIGIGKRLYVVVSHHHKDHYVKEIFSWSHHFSEVRYILSKDTAKFARHILSPDSLYIGAKPDPSIVTVLKPGESFSDGFISVEAFGSTDIGNSYAINAGGTTLFHAGDLNAWIWKDESTEEEVKLELKKYTDILSDIAAKYPRFDLAMFPVDSRIGTDYFTGARLFVRAIDVAHFFPMHFGLGTPDEQQRYQLNAAAVERYANPERGEYICLQSPYSCFIKSTP